MSKKQPRPASSTSRTPRRDVLSTPPAALKPGCGTSALPLELWDRLGRAQRAKAVGPLAWKEGLSASGIVKRLNLPSGNHYQMQVQRAMSFSHREMLAFKPPVSDDLASKLDYRINVEERRRRRTIAFHVVEDSYGPSLASVPARAAEIITEAIIAAAREMPHANGGRVVIANAGGQTVRETVKAIQRNGFPWNSCAEEESEQLRQRLTFVGGNAAYHPHCFHWSANFLSVTLAETFGADHFALPISPDAEALAKYRQLVDQTAVFVCGVGSNRGGLLARYFQAHGWSIPDWAIGDVAFNLLDATGKQVPLAGEAAEFMSQVNPIFNADELTRIAGERRVVVVLDGEHPLDKVDISVAMLRRAYVTDVVVGSRLARGILDRYTK